jgi:hypothetical protein
MSCECIVVMRYVLESPDELGCEFELMGQGGRTELWVTNSFCGN